MINEKNGGSSGTPTINTNYTRDAGNASWWVKQGNIVHFYVGLLITIAEIPAYGTIATGFPKAKSTTRIIGQVGIGSTTAVQSFVISNTSLLVGDSGSYPTNTYLYVGGTYIAEE